jgi:hypothetical protein
VKTQNELRLLKALKNLVAAIEAGITTETFIACADNPNSYMAQARKAIQAAEWGDG